jgi:hypothetical protein
MKKNVHNKDRSICFYSSDRRQNKGSDAESEPYFDEKRALNMKKNEEPFCNAYIDIKDDNHYH